MPSGFIDSPVYCGKNVNTDSPLLPQTLTYKFVVLEVANDLLSEVLGTLLELLNLIRVGLLELSLDRLHVALRRYEILFLQNT